MYYRLSADDGATWGNPVLVVDFPGYPPPLLRTDANGVFMGLWNRMTGGAQDVYFTVSPNQGVNWPFPNNISNNAGDSQYPALDLAANGGLLVAWQDDTWGLDEVYYARSADNGANFTPPNLIGNSVHSTDIEVEAASPGEVYIFWVNADFTFPLFPNIDGYMSHSTDNGANFSGGVRFRGYSSSHIDQSVCVDTAGNINHVATDYNYSYFYALFSRSLDQGANWESYAYVSPPTVNAGMLDMIVDSAGNIYMVYDDSANPTGPGGQVYFCRSLQWLDR